MQFKMQAPFGFHPEQRESEANIEVLNPPISEENSDIVNW